MKKLISEKSIDLLGYRIQQEQLSSRIYEQMYLWLSNESYINAAKLWLKYSQEELIHANWAKDFLMSFNVMPELRDLDAPVSNFTSLENIIEITFNHEMDVTLQCQELAKHALTENEFMLYELALKYCKEQSEEIDKVFQLQDLIKMSTDKLIIDTYIGENLL